MAASTDLVTAAEVKTYLGLSGSTHDTLIDELIDLTSEFIEDYCNTHFSSTAVTQKIDGGGEYLIVDRAPIISITSITDNEDSTTVDSGDYDFYAVSGLIYRDNDAILFPDNELTWAKGRQRFTVVCQAGYASVPEAIKWVCYQLIGRHLKVLPNTNNKGRFTQPPHMDNNEAKAAFKRMLTDEEMLILSRYRNTVV
jgi:hypothetical protein